MIETEAQEEAGHTVHEHTFNTPRKGPEGGKIRPGTREEGTGTTTYVRQQSQNGTVSKK